MWYLQSGTFLLIAAFSLAIAVLRKLLSQKILNVLLPVAEIALVAFISVKLAVFYAVYVALGIFSTWLLLKFRKKALFALLCVVAAVPFFIGRLDAFGLAVPTWFEGIGIAFAMLKAIDALYYVYYSGEAVSPVVYVNYLLFLPVFTAGPVFRYRDFKKTFESPIPLTAAELAQDFKRVIRGMFKKVVLAEIAVTAMNQLLLKNISVFVSLAVTVVSYFILFFDLSGYSDIAIAFGRLAGFDVPENFKRPMLAPSFTQFWRSWHASLSDWIREHIYVVVVKKRLKKPATAMIAFFTMVIMSLWHGFNLPYLLAGAYNGLLLMCENLFSLTTVNSKKTKKSVYYLRCFAVNFLFALNTLVFTLPPERLPEILRGFFKI